MLSRDFSSYRCLAHLVLSAIVVAGCASGPTSIRTGASPDAASRRAAIEQRLRKVPSKAVTMYEQAVATMAAGDLAGAGRRFGEFVSTFPGYPGAHVNLAIIRAQAGDDRAVEGHINDALVIDPRHPAALNQLGLLRRRQGKFVEAEAAYLKAVTASPDYALAHYNLGVLNELYFQRLDAALQHFERYQEIEGEDRTVSKWIADLERRLSAEQRAAKVTE
ncbi:MAG: tetratricopeptide repeat protein [Woeseia sp.]